MFSFHTRDMVYKNPLDPRKVLSRQRHYLKNKQHYIDRAKKSKQVMREYVRSFKQKPCEDCGTEYPYYVMQFDHVLEKDYTIAVLVNFNNRGKIEREIKKCDVVCATCHAERTRPRNKATKTRRHEG